MVVIKWFLLSLFISLTACGQFDWYENQRRYYTYSPTTDTAINIGTTSATLIGSDGRAKSNKSDTLATKLSPIRRMTWWSDTDSIVYLNDNLKVLGRDWYVNDYNHDTIFVSSGLLGSIAQFRFNRSVRITYSFQVINYVSGIVYFGGWGENFVDTLSSNGIYTGEYNSTNGIIYFNANGNTSMGITSFMFDILADSITSKSINLSGLQPNTTYKYRYSVSVKTYNGDKSVDLHYGEIKTFTTNALPSLPSLPLLATENGKYTITEDGNYITFDLGE